MSSISEENNEEINVDTLAENKKFAIELIEQAHYSIDIFTQDMDDAIYNNKKIETIIFKLAKRHPGTNIRILVQNSTKAAQNGHCLIRLAQSLSSSVFIHNPAREHMNEQCAFLIVDKTKSMYRLSANNYNARINIMSPQPARKLADFFNDIWQHSTPDIQTRRIYI